MKIPSRIILKAMLALLIGSLSAFAATQTLLDRVVAVVDDDVVLQSEFDQRLSEVRQRQASGAIQSGIPLNELRRLVLDQLIMENLKLQMAARSGIQIGDNELNQYISDSARQQGMTFEQFVNQLDALGIYQQTRQEIRNSLMIQILENGAVRQRITITRQEIDNYLRSEAAQTEIAPEYRVQHIQIPNVSESQQEIHAELASLLYTRLQDGADIIELANSRSILGIEVSGGDLPGWRKVEALPSIFREIVPTLEVGEISEPFTSPNGFHIVKLLDRRGGAELKLNQTLLRHIMLAENEIRTLDQAEALAWELHRRILDGEDFGDLARIYTDDPGSMVSGGELPWTSEGELPPAFEAIIEQTEIGEVTQPFFVPNSGWHVAEVLDRRVQDVTEENRRFLAEDILRNRKYVTELQNWETEIRDSAYIDIKL